MPFIDEKRFNSKIYFVFGHSGPMVGVIPATIDPPQFIKEPDGHSPFKNLTDYHFPLIPTNDTLTIPVEVRSPSMSTTEPKEPPASFDDDPQLNVYRPTRSGRPI